MSSDQQQSICDWIALTFVIGVGSRTAATLIDRFGSPAAVFEASVQSLEQAGLRRDTIEVIKSAEPRERARHESEELERLGGEGLILSDDRYPALLRETYDLPLLFTVEAVSKQRFLNQWWQ